MTEGYTKNIKNKKYLVHVLLKSQENFTIYLIIKYPCVLIINIENKETGDNTEWLK